MGGIVLTSRLPSDLAFIAPIIFGDTTLHDYEFDQDTRDHTFDPFLLLTTLEARSAVSECILPLCDSAFPRKRKRRKDDEERFMHTLRLVVANALRASGHPTSRRVHYSRKAETYSGESVYYREWFRYTNLINAVDAMGAAGLLHLTTGDNDNWFTSFSKLPQSTFQASKGLLERLGDYGVTTSDAIKSADAPVVVLKEADHKLMEYQPDDPAIRCLIESVRGYNEFIRQCDVWHDLSSGQLAALHSKREKDGRARPPTNFNDIALRRVFNNADFGQGGRWFGGWWQTVPSEYRQFILIDKQRTVELDYSGFHIRGIYHLNGTDYRDDPYEIEPIVAAADAQGLDWESVRDSIKQLTNILINAKQTDRIGKISELTMPKGFKLPNRVYPLIMEKHKAINSVFRTGFGLPMMRMESDVCEGILQEGKRKGILVLPIHDSFVVQERHEGWLEEVMLSIYRSQFGFNPIIKKKESEVLRDEEMTINKISPLKGNPLQDPSIGETVREDDRQPWSSETNNPVRNFFADQKERQLAHIWDRKLLVRDA